jgi:hypothetical protein
MALETFLVLVWRLAAGILAVQAPGQPVSPEDAVSWATAAAYHARASEVDPFELIGIARNESDFRPNLVGPDGKDCGMMQTRVLYSRYKCRQLRQDPWLSFEEAARRLRENQARCTKRAKWDVKRCRLNSYNSGIRYAKKGRAGGYWLRVSCFTEAAREGVTPVGDCRGVQSRGDIARLLRASRSAEQALARNEGRTPFSL